MAIDPQTANNLAAAYTAAWNSGSPETVAAFYASDGQIVINRGDPWIGRAGVAEMAAGFFADVPDLLLACDEVRVAGDHIAFFWTFTGTHSATGNPLRIVGWEEWDLDADLKVAASRGWYDAEDYARQTKPGQPETNRQNAIAFYRTAYLGDPVAAVSKYVGADYVQHNPLVGDGKQAFIDYFTEMAESYPGKSIEFVRAVAEGDLVALHTHQTWPGGDEYVTMDFFRFDAEGKIIEHWDAVQKLPGESKNNNPMY